MYGNRRAGMNQTVFKQIAEIIRTEAEGEPKPQLTDVTPDPETIDRIASLLRKGVCRGIYPQWSLRKALGADASPEKLALIADQVESPYLSGETPFGWRIDIRSEEHTSELQSIMRI